jgi:D-alanyl-D-alanine carboxypeptidase (penicillin-binding protein 5/6)
LFKKDTVVGNAQVQLGDSSEVSLVAPRDLSLTIPAGVLSKVGGMKIRYNGPVKAPIAKGQHIADLVVTTSDSGDQVMPLVAAEAVGEAGFFGRAWIGLKQLFGMA